MARKPPGQPDGLARALENLADGVSTLVREHLELARVELREDASQAAQNLGLLVLCGVIAVVGYLMLNVAGVALGAVLFGDVGLASAAFALALFNFVGSLALLKRVSDSSQGGFISLRQTTKELSRDRAWLRQIRDDSKHEETPAELS